MEGRVLYCEIFCLSSKNSKFMVEIWDNRKSYSIKSPLVRCLQEEDSNARFFHKANILRGRRKRIIRIQWMMMMRSKVSISNIFMITETSWIIYSGDLAPQRSSIEQNLNLIAPIARKEIDATMMILPSDISEGVLPLFHMAFQTIIKANIIMAMKKFAGLLVYRTPCTR